MSPALLAAFTSFGRWKNPQTRPYRMPELQRYLHASPVIVAFVLKTHGWRCDRMRPTRFNRRRHEAWWLPPGCPPMPRRPPGRPSLAETYALAEMPAGDAPEAAQILFFNPKKGTHHVWNR